MKSFLKAVLLFSFFNLNISYGSNSYSKDFLMEWRNLLHYKSSFFNKSISLADGKDFFISQDGKHNPLKELEATISLLEKSSSKYSRLKIDPKCVFIGRRKLLEKYGYLNKTKTDCKDYNKWKEAINPKFVSVIFSTSYPNNPSSLFGHTFLKFSNSKKSSLLNYTAAYSAAVTGNDWGPLYVYKGLTGGYPGYFDLTPYYQKINEYNDVESRDLYEYKLNIPNERVEFLLSHIWELYVTTHFDYFFLDENCSYLLAEILKVAMPKWNLKPLRKGFYLPSDLIRVISSNKDAVQSVEFRPSRKRRLEALYKTLGKNKIKEIQKLVSNKNSEIISTDVATLDGLIEYYNFKKFANEGVVSTVDKKKYRQALVLRSSAISKNTVNNLVLNYKQNNRPENGHLPSKVIFGRMINKDMNILGYKLGYHDLLAKDEGLEPFSEFELFNIKVLVNDSGKIKLDQFSGVSIVSLHPHEFYDAQWSWKARLDNKRLPSAYCNGCRGTQLLGGIGKSFALNDDSIFYSMGTLSVLESRDYLKGWESGLGFEVSYLQRILEGLKVQLLASIKSDVKESFTDNYFSQLSFNSSYSLSKNTEARMKINSSTRRNSFQLEETDLTIEFSQFF